nr:unnamed protein product [Callosobruchus analis]
MDCEQDQVLKAIWHYQERLGKYASNGSDEKLLYTLGKLKKLPIKTAHLENTGVGRTVNGLKKLGGDVGEAAKSLVALWKEMVLQEEQKAEEEEQSNDIDSSYSSENESNKLKIDEPILTSTASPTINEVRESSAGKEHNKKDSHRSGKGSDRSSNKESNSKEKDKHRNDKDYRVSNREEKSSQHSKENGAKSDKHRDNKHSSSSHSKSSKNSDRNKSESSHKSSTSSKETEKSNQHKSSKHNEDKQNHKKKIPQ